MEGYHYNPESNWSPDQCIELEYPDGTSLRLHWGDTQVFRFGFGDGKYDYIEHFTEDTTYQIFLDTTELGDDLDERGYSVMRQDWVEDAVMESRRLYDLEAEAEQLAAQLEQVTGPEDFLNL